MKRTRSLRYVVPLLGAAAAASIIAAPTATAASTSPDCTYTSGSGDTQCQSPGNVDINNAPPPVSYHPHGDMPFLLGGLLLPVDLPAVGDRGEDPQTSDV